MDGDEWDAVDEWDEVFRALDDPTRRRLLDLLRQRDGLTLRELCEQCQPAGITRQAVSKHITVLARANLLSIVKHGRSNLHHLNPIPLQQVMDRWFRPYDRGRPAVLTRLKRSLEEKTMKPQFVYTIYILAPAEEVYRALVDPDLIAEYMDGSGPKSDFKVGSPVLWKSYPEGEFEDLDQEITEAEPGKVLAYTWHRFSPSQREMFDSDEEYQAARQEKSHVRFTLEEAEEASMGTKLTITHDGFDSPESKMLESVAGGWTMILSSLKTTVERHTA